MELKEPVAVKVSLDLIMLTIRLNDRSLNEEAFRGNATSKVLDDVEIEAMKFSCRLGREVLDETAEAIEVGVTTDEIDHVVHEACSRAIC